VVIIQLYHFHFIMAATMFLRIHAAIVAVIADSFIKPERIKITHAIMIIHDHTRGEREVHKHCKGCYKLFHRYNKNNHLSAIS
jgi:hypothetical protein